VERLLAERAAVCWLACYEADLACRRFEGAASPRLVTYFERRRDRAQRRFVSAVRALAALRKLAVPARRPQVDFGGLLKALSPHTRDRVPNGSESADECSTGLTGARPGGGPCRFGP
jgi:hypothetical protein